MSAANLTGGSVHSHRNGLDTGDCRCPWCLQKIDETVRLEIQIRQDELAAEIEEQVKRRLITERDAEIERVREEATVSIEAAQQAMAKREAVIRREATATASGSRSEARQGRAGEEGGRAADEGAQVEHRSCYRGAAGGSAGNLREGHRGCRPG